MRAVRIDFKKPSIPPHEAWVATAALWAIAIAITGWSEFEATRVERLRQQLVSAMQEPERPATPAAKPATYDASAREMLKESNSSWPSGLVAIEGLQEPGVFVSSVEVLPQDGVIRVDIECASLEQLLSVLSDLNAGEPTPRWRLQNSETVVVAGRGAVKARVLGAIDR